MGDRASMRCLSLLLAALLLLSAPLVDAKKKPRRGVFGTINGKAFKATNLLGVDDYCVEGQFSPSERRIGFQALECRGKRRRQGAQKKNYKIMVVSCGANGTSVDMTTVPFDVACPAAIYSEYKTGRFGIPVSSVDWMSTFEFQPDASTLSSLRLRVDAVDGANVRGALYGSFATPTNGAAGPAAISGELSIDFPFALQ